MSYATENPLIDMIQRHTGCNEEKAIKTLLEADNEVMEAIAIIERENKGRENQENTWKEQIRLSGLDLWSTIRELVKEVNTVRISVYEGKRELVSLPVTIGGLLAYWFPRISLIGLTAMLVKKYTLVVERRV
ncbi:DUF4342 domain-containing protein [Microaerobacter geothermalis]|uniref:DUF4342 domain-containing protein n=1 Tax=Microaerobacter geothermalis TaxID=674972 RepID=UPI001F3ABE2B|nr:DUF4342 domain-containing protein [Microaerobacter geothermalis]MCF6092817.1 DUF4342 domain-containing protein [Microaerobacter geothermalis]